ncbi:MAG: HD domain-containing phosphohydrolase, partial [Pseudomonadota bacterium]
PLSEALYYLASNLMAALKNSLLYSTTHSTVRSALLMALQKARQAFLAADAATYICIERELVIDGRPMNKKAFHFEKMAEVMQSVGLQRLTFLPGLTLEELENFILDLSRLTDEDGRGESTIRSSAHVKVGRVMTGQGTRGGGQVSHQDLIRLMAAGSQGEELVAGEKASTGEELREVSTDFLREAQEAIASLFSQDFSLTLTDQDSASHFVRYFLKFADTIFPLAPLKEHDELTFNHSVNVALLCAAQAQALGLAPELFGDIALCGLLHDLGKLKVPPEVLNKTGKLEREEKLLLARHPELGAELLAGKPGVPRLVLAAAYEHHMHWNGQGGYPRSGRVLQPHPVSQVVMLADFYEAALTDKAYRKAQTLEYVADILVQRSGTQFAPDLVKNFFRALQAMELTGKSLLLT